MDAELSPSRLERARVREPTGSPVVMKVSTMAVRISRSRFPILGSAGIDSGVSCLGPNRAGGRNCFPSILPNYFRCRSLAFGSKFGSGFGSKKSKKEVGRRQAKRIEGSRKAPSARAPREPVCCRRAQHGIREKRQKAFRSPGQPLSGVEFALSRDHRPRYNEASPSP